MFTLVVKLNIFEYTHFRDFLRDVYERNKAEGRFSFRQFALAGGFRSPSFLKLVIDGKRNLSHESIDKFAKALRLKRDEKKYFTHLVLLNQADSIEEKKYYAELLVRSRGYKRVNPLKESQYEYYTRWYHVALRELVGTAGFREDPEWISQTLIPKISASEARAALATLLELGLLKRGKGGKLAVTDRTLSTGDEVDSALIAGFHRQMIERASESLDLFSGREREISAITFGSDEPTMEALRELTRRFRKEALALIVNSKVSNRVYELNFQLFPLSLPVEASRKRGKK